MNEVKQQITVRVLGWSHVIVMVAITLLVYFAMSGEIRVQAKSNRATINELRIEIQSLNEKLDGIQQHQAEFCFQYEQDMDRFFRDHPEFKRHPWVCETK